MRPNINIKRKKVLASSLWRQLMISTLLSIPFVLITCHDLATPNELSQAKLSLKNETLVINDSDSNKQPKFSRGKPSRKE